ncbi:cytidyltransferase [Dysgonomonas sp. 521]|uniref:AAA family ATPase n=1 Tax=Dysgonomonas sp. 521 TaxID=2302932 RepID=UPI0013D6C7C1|nr:AAA family ATPase [Dysgonomonas sp. 521]NDV93930.1 cytidyltransferase [Dysgonomonas sp. 521]
MDRGFIFGKFLPFHKGHEAMIRFALTQVDFLSVLVCASDKENIPADIRKSWIEKTFADTSTLDVIAFDYKESDLPNSSESSRNVSKIWAEIFKIYFPDYGTVITSEPYGEYVAEYMGINHILFDMERNTVPVTASKIRSDLFSYWEYLPDAVKPDMVIKVVILGTESTGKTVLTGKLARHYNATAVFEAGRDIIPDSNDFSINDLYLVADEHARRIKQSETKESPLIIIDTDIHITKSYGRFSFDEELVIDQHIYEANKADLYLYLDNDIEFVQDGTRMDEESRNRLDASHREILREHAIPYIEIAGDWDERFGKAVEEIDRLIENRKTDIGNWFTKEE